MTTPIKRIRSFFSGEKPLIESLTISSSQSDSHHDTPQEAPQGTQETPAPSPQTPKVRVVFMGTPDLSASLLSTLLEQGYNIVGVVTKADKPVGRKKEISTSPVKEVAERFGLPLLQPEKIDASAIASIQNWKPDLIVVAAYGKILPQEILSIPGFGCINFHTSLLPRYRGASPIQNALLSGDTETGVTLMLMDVGMDTGDIITQTSVAIDPTDTTPVLTDKLLTAGTTLLIETLPLWIERRITPTPQNEADATLCQLIERSDGRILWSDDAESIYNRYRALSPWPGIFTYYKRDDSLLRLKLLTVSVQKQNAQVPHQIGMVFEIGEKIGVQTGNGILFLEAVQLEGKTPVSIQDFINGDTKFVGTLLQ